MLDDPVRPSPDMLVLARAYRDGIAALLRKGGAASGPDLAESPSMHLPGVPQSWRDGVSLLAALPAPDGITPARWAVLAATCARLLRDHGAELNRGGWDTLDVFGLHRLVPLRRRDCMRLAWLLDGRVIGLITPETVAVFAAGDHTLRAWRMGQQARREAVPAWALLRTECELDHGGV